MTQRWRETLATLIFVAIFFGSGFVTGHIVGDERATARVVDEVCAEPIARYFDICEGTP